jgi:hypothetical protein
MADDLNNLFFNLEGAPENPFKEQPAEGPASAAAAETAVPVTTTEAPADDLNSDINLEMQPEQIEEVLRETWKENFDENFAAASATIQEIFHADSDLINWFAERLGNHANIPLLAYRVHCMLNGSRPAKVTPPTAQSKSLDEGIAAFQVGGSKYERWMAGDVELNKERIRLYEKKHAK